jgi:hypothetical protein
MIFVVIVIVIIAIGVTGIMSKNKPPDQDLKNTKESPLNSKKGINSISANTANTTNALMKPNKNLNFKPKKSIIFDN